MAVVSSPTEVMRFREAYGQLWKQYLLGAGIADADALNAAPFDYWQLLYGVDDQGKLLRALTAELPRNPAPTLRLLCAVEDLLGFDNLSLNTYARRAVFPGNFFADAIAPQLPAAYTLKAKLGYMRLIMLVNTLDSLAEHIKRQHITPHCHAVATSDTYRAAMREVGVFVRPVEVSA